METLTQQLGIKIPRQVLDDPLFQKTRTTLADQTVVLSGKTEDILKNTRELIKFFPEQADVVKRDMAAEIKANLDELASRQGLEGIETKIFPQAVRGAEIPKVEATKAVSSLDNSSVFDAPTIKDPENLSDYKSLRSKLDGAWINFRENVQDDWFRVRRLIDDRGLKITEASDPYQAEILFHGRIGSKIEDLRDTIKAIDSEIVRVASDIKVPNTQFTQEVNDFLIARHAPERNAQLFDGAAGVTTKEAGEVLARLDKLPYAKELRRVADEIQKVNNQTLDILRDGEVITDDLYDLLRTKYKNHIPLQRVLESEDDFAGALARGFDVRGTGIKRAIGSKKEVADILGNVSFNLEQATIRAEKNRVDLATLKMIRDNQDKVSDLFKVRKPKAVGQDWQGRPIMERVTDPSTLVMKEKGKTIFVEITDPHLAVALRGVNRQKLSGMMKGIAWVSRTYSGIHTRFNPEFAFSNKVRDLQEVLTFTAAQGELGVKGTAKVAASNLRLENERAVLDWMRGKNTSGAKLYQQMRADGGTTGGLGLSTRAKVELDIGDIRKINRSNPRAAAEKVVRAVDNWNQIFEDSTRLAVYRIAIENGATRARAASLAKQSSVNFNKFGKQGPMINALWIFANASIQGSTKMLQAMKNPKVAASVSIAVFSSVYAANEWNDFVDPDWRNKVTTWDKLNSLVLMIPTEGEDAKYITIPVAWGIKPIKVISDQLYDTAFGYADSIADSMGAIMISMLEAYNPAGGTNLVSAITPTILDVPVELARNQAWHGGMIRPDWDRNAPPSIQYFRELADSTTGRIAIGLSKGLSGVGMEVSPADIKYGYEQVIGGAGRAVSKTVNTIIGIAKGELPPPKEFPVISRFFKKREVETFGSSTSEFKQLEGLLQEQSRERFILKQQAEDALKQMEALSKEDAVELWNKVNREDEELAEKISELKKQKDKGLTFMDRQILSLGVENQERAKFLVEKFNSLKSKEDKAKLWGEYQKKGIISDRVGTQIKKLLNQQSSR